jgi:hypothetical protein
MNPKFVKTTLLKAGLLLLVSVVSFQLSLAQQAPDKNISPKIEVVYFHAPNRCPSCVANETQTKQALEKHFKSEIASGQVSFVSLDLKDDKNKALVEKYEIVFPTLLILKKQGDKEVKTDYTNTAFDYAFNEPDKYEKLLQTEILNQLNSK